jgi:hypothetical protein
LFFGKNKFLPGGGETNAWLQTKGEKFSTDGHFSIFSVR